MIRGRCPTCARSFEITSIAELPSFPFCSNRCRLIDLGRWLDEKQRLPIEPEEEEEAEPPPKADS